MPLAFAGGLAAAASTLVVFLGLGVVGWFLTDGGAHGAPRDGLRVGALGWLLGHGSGVTVEGAAITAMPLGVTLVCAWAIWRIGQRVGDSISGHGPDASGLSDGERDWTVPLASGLFALGYVVTAVLVVSVAATPSTDPSTAGVVGWSLALCLFVGAPAIAVGAGRAAIWLAAGAAARAGDLHPCSHRAGHLRGWRSRSRRSSLALVVDFDTAANIMSQLDANAGDTVLFVVLSLLVLPNARRLLRLLPARAGLHRRHRHPGHPAGRRDRRPADVSDAGRPARQRPGSGVDRLAARGPGAGRRARSGLGAAELPDHALGRGRAARLRGRHRGRRRLRR